MTSPSFDNVLVTRYASQEMSRLWSSQTRYGLWRRLWLALARAEPAKSDPVRSRALRAEALALLGGANKAEPDSYQTLYAFAQARSDEPGYPTDNTLNVLERAFTLAPQVQDIRLTTALALATRGYYPEAISLLEPIANSPHGGKLADKADGLLKAWREKTAPPAARP